MRINICEQRIYTVDPTQISTISTSSSRRQQQQLLSSSATGRAASRRSTLRHTHDIEYSIQVLRCLHQIKAITREMQTICYSIHHIHPHAAAKLHRHFELSYNRFKRLCTALMMILANMGHIISRDRISSFRAEICGEWRLAEDARRIMDIHASLFQQEQQRQQQQSSEHHYHQHHHQQQSAASPMLSSPGYESSPTPEPPSPASSSTIGSFS